MEGLQEIRKFQALILFPNDLGISHVDIDHVSVHKPIHLNFQMDRPPIGQVLKHWVDGDKWMGEFELWDSAIIGIIDYCELSATLMKAFEVRDKYRVMNFNINTNSKLEEVKHAED